MTDSEGPDSGSGSKQWVSFRVHPEDLERFERAFPMHGAKQWFFEGCLKELLRRFDSGEAQPPVDLKNLSVEEVTKDL